jgi:hypothetical protein
LAALSTVLLPVAMGFFCSVVRDGGLVSGLIQLVCLGIQLWLIWFFWFDSGNVTPEAETRPGIVIAREYP